MTDDPAPSRVAVVVLGAGHGTRMKSDRPKVLHPLAGRPLVRHVLAAVEPLRAERLVVVAGAGMPELARAVAPVRTVVQEPPLGTAHAVLAAREALAGFPAGPGAADVLVVFGDAAMIDGGTLRDLVLRRRDRDAAVALLGVRLADGRRYGRLVKGPDGGLLKIVEHGDATAEERRSTLCNSGTMALCAHRMFDLLDAVGDRNSKGEFQLTEVAALCHARGLAMTALEVDGAEDLVGVDDRADLARFEAAMQRRLRSRALAAGCGMPAPETVHLSWDTRIGRDVVIGPHVVIGPGVVLEDGAEVHSFSHLEGCTVGRRARVGPYARLRPGAWLGVGAVIGNFVEVKQARVEEGARASHVSYIGDARVGAGANIGAGTIVCNYDGYLKHPTEIGARAFVGSNTSLVAPVSVGEDAIVGAGSTITHDVPADALAVERSDQVTRDGLAGALRRKKAALKARRERDGA